MKVICPQCNEKFELDKNEYDEVDRVECPECGELSKIKVVKGVFKLKAKKEDIHNYDEIDYSDED